MPTLIAQRRSINLPPMTKQTKTLGLEEKKRTAFSKLKKKKKTKNVKETKTGDERTKNLNTSCVRNEQKGRAISKNIVD